MYRIDKARNRIQPLKGCSFGELGFKERPHLQEWIANEPAVLGEELLIIQKEFAGFSDTNERLDLLALDKQGSLVVIENKLDDAGRDVTWQALKYASYCASLSRDNIRSIYQDFLNKGGSGQTAEDRLCEFFDVDDIQELNLNKGVTQRIILIAAKFRKEVTSTVLWLMSFKVRLQCFRATPYSMDDQLFLNVEQIIPTPDAEDFMVSLAGKAQDEIGDAEAEMERHVLRREFWAELLKAMNTQSDLYSNVAPRKQNSILAGSGIGGVGFSFSVTKEHGRVEVYIGRSNKAMNEAIFDLLLQQRAEIEQAFGGILTWERLDTNQACRVKVEYDGNVFDRDRWPEMVQSMTTAMCRLEAAFRQPLNQVRTKMKAGELGEAE